MLRRVGGGEAEDAALAGGSSGRASGDGASAAGSDMQVEKICAPAIIFAIFQIFMAAPQRRTTAPSSVLSRTAPVKSVFGALAPGKTNENLVNFSPSKDLGLQLHLLRYPSHPSVRSGGGGQGGRGAAAGRTPRAQRGPSGQERHPAPGIQGQAGAELCSHLRQDRRAQAQGASCGLHVIYSLMNAAGAGEKA